MVRLPDPRNCPTCKTSARVRLLETRKRKYAIWRTLRYLTCKAKWNTCESIVAPLDLPQETIETHHR